MASVIMLCQRDLLSSGLCWVENLRSIGQLRDSFSLFVPTTVISRSELSYLGPAAALLEVPLGPAGAKRLAAWEQDPEYKRTTIAAMQHLHAQGAEVPAEKMQLVAYLDYLIRLYVLMKSLPGVRRGVYRDKITKKLQVG